MVWVKRIGLALTAVVLLAAGAVYGKSEWMMRRHVSADAPDLVAATDPADIAEGERLSHVLGCQGCHAPGAVGQVLNDNFLLGRIVAPGLAGVAAGASDAQLAMAIRNGVSTRGTELFVMPSNEFNRLSDHDVARLIGWMRSLKRSPKDLTGEIRAGPLARFGLVMGQYQGSFEYLGMQAKERPADTGPYFVGMVCAHCHKLDRPNPLGFEPETAPALAPIAAAYSREDLIALLRTGKAAGGRDLQTMSDVSREDLHYLSDDEIGQIQDYLKGVAERLPTT